MTPCNVKELVLPPIPLRINIQSEAIGSLKKAFSSSVWFLELHDCLPAALPVGDTSDGLQTFVKTHLRNILQSQTFRCLVNIVRQGESPSFSRYTELQTTNLC